MQVLAFGYLMPYSIPARVEVYASLSQAVRPLELYGGSDVGLERVEGLVRDLQYLNTLNSLYDMLHGLNLIVFVARLLTLSHFQPRLGVVTITLARCSRDLLHFLVVLALVVSVSAMILHLVFGGVSTPFSEIGHAFQCIFNLFGARPPWVQRLGRGWVHHPCWRVHFWRQGSAMCGATISLGSCALTLIFLFVAPAWKFLAATAFQDSSFMDIFFFMPTPLNYPGTHSPGCLRTLASPNPSRH